MKEFPTPKSQDELQKQAAQTALYGGVEVPESLPALLQMSEEELKVKYPQQYESYLSELRFLSRAETEHIHVMTRRFCVKVTRGDEQFISKALESPFESDIAKRAAELGIGPKQLSALPGVVREEFIKGAPLLELSDEQCTPEFMERLGEETAQKITLLHENNILINDQILTDDLGKSHLILDENKEVRFIDFGAAVDLADYPNISDDAVYSLMRTDPLAVSRLLNMSREDLPSVVAEYRKGVLPHYPTKEDVIEWKDINLLREGLSFLSTRLPNVQAFAKGVARVLSQKD